MRGALKRLFRRNTKPTLPPGKQLVKSLLDAMEDGREYASLVDCAPQGLNIRDELRRSITEVSVCRDRPLLLYAGNVVTTNPHPLISLSNADELPFAEMVDSVPENAKEVDVLVVTPGGSAQTASYFVDKLRNRFENISFLIPYCCMSAGTILVLSGDEIWMDERAYIGPIDPQIMSRDGSRFVPLLSIWVLLGKIQKDGQNALATGGQPDWTQIQILKNLDPKELGDALSASDYSTQLAAGYLRDYKFKNWTVREGTGQAVDDTYRSQRAEEIAKQLCDHELWKMHSHRIPRDSVESDLGLQIEKFESIPDLARAIHRLWALLYFLFENSSMLKIILSEEYAVFRHRVQASKS